MLKLKTPWRNGTTHIVMTPMEFMQRLAALVPRPRLHLIRFHGVLAPNARLRSQGVPVPAQKTTTGEGDCPHEHSAPVRMTWARLLKRVFDIDIERCACGGKLKLIAVIEAPAVIEKILDASGSESAAAAKSTRAAAGGLAGVGLSLMKRAVFTEAEIPARPALV